MHRKRVVRGDRRTVTSDRGPELRLQPSDTADSHGPHHVLCIGTSVLWTDVSTPGKGRERRASAACGG